MWIGSFVTAGGWGIATFLSIVHWPRSDMLSLVPVVKVVTIAGRM